MNDSRMEGSGPRQMMRVADLVHWSIDWPKHAPWYLRHFALERAGHLWAPAYYGRGIRRCAAAAVDRFAPGMCPTAAAEADTYLAVSTGLRTGNGFTYNPPPDASHRLDALKAGGQTFDSLLFMERYRLGYHLASLSQLLDDAARRGVPVTLVDMPVPADLDGRLYVAEYAAYRAALDKIAGDHEVTLYSATRVAVGLTDADFGDLIHLNSTGAAKLSVWLRHMLTCSSSTSGRTTH